MATSVRALIASRRGGGGGGGSGSSSGGRGSLVDRVVESRLTGESIFGSEEFVTIGGKPYFEEDVLVALLGGFRGGGAPRTASDFVTRNPRVRREVEERLAAMVLPRPPGSSRAAPPESVLARPTLTGPGGLG